MKSKEYQDGVIIKIRAKPYAPKPGIKEIGGELVVEVKNPPIKGRANQDILEFLKKLFKREVEILKGHKSKQKIIWIKRATLAEVEKILGENLSR